MSANLALSTKAPRLIITGFVPDNSGRDQGSVEIGGFRGGTMPFCRTVLALTSPNQFPISRPNLP